ncbi:MAG: carboxylesterase/lipase family protein [Sphingobacteriales bacterium]
MKKIFYTILFILFVITAYTQPANETLPLQVKTANGMLEGVNESGIISFKGIPFAAPPVGELRWKEPQPVKNWEGIRKADKFGPRAMQRSIYGDMVFRSDGVSEDCLYLNIWTPAKSAADRFPVLVYFYGGGFTAGDGSEPRYDGEMMARRGLVAITVNYRLNVFGFFAHPELTKESPHHSSGNYGLMDQSAALHWVKENIAAFGGDPNKITIAGESAGSSSVSAQMASPLSKNIIAGAIGESGSMLEKEYTVSLAEGEQDGVKFATIAGAKSLAELRKMSASKLLEVSASREGEFFHVTVDGYFFPKSPGEIYTAGEQAHVPLLVGWNTEEMNYHALMGPDNPTKENFIKAVKLHYPFKADEILKLYNPVTDEEAEQVATDFSGDTFIGFGTWKWSDVHCTTGRSPVYRYLYARPRPAIRSHIDNMLADPAGGVKKGNHKDIKKTPLAKGAVHSAEIEYALGNLPTNRVYDWATEDYKVSDIMQNFFANFIKTGNPNGFGVPAWPTVKSGSAAVVMHIDVNTKTVTEKNRERYLLLDKF